MPAPLLLSHILVVKVARSSTVNINIITIILLLLQGLLLDNWCSVQFPNKRAKMQHLSYQESLEHGVSYTYI